MRRRHDAYAEIKQRLDEWGDYRRNIAHAVGWNVNMLDFDDAIRGIQKRNDTHSDPVAQEVGRMRYEERRDMITDTAVTELRPRWMRKLIIGKYKRWPDSTDSELARRLGYKQPQIGYTLRIAYDHLIELIEGLEHQRHNAA